MAKEQLLSLEYWFRNKYKLSPKDSRFLDCEPWEIELDYETEKVMEKISKQLQTVCSKCGKVNFGERCISCGSKITVEKYYDPNFEAYELDVEKENEEFFENLKWEEVKD